MIIFYFVSSFLEVPWFTREIHCFALIHVELVHLLHDSDPHHIPQAHPTKPRSRVTLTEICPMIVSCASPAVCIMNDWHKSLVMLRLRRSSTRRWAWQGGRWGDWSSVTKLICPIIALVLFFSWFIFLMQNWILFLGLWQIPCCMAGVGIIKVWHSGIALILPHTHLPCLTILWLLNARAGAARAELGQTLRCSREPSQSVVTLKFPWKHSQLTLSKPQPNLNTSLGLTIKWLCTTHPTQPPHRNSMSVISQLLLTRFW